MMSLLRVMAPALPLVALLGIVFGPGANRVLAAEADLVGVLALAVEDAAVDELQLTEAQRKALLGLIDAREAEAVELVLRIKGLPQEQSAAQLAAFRRESETRGLALLTAQQRRRVETLRVRRLGLAALREPQVLDRLQLTSQQQQQVDELLKAHAPPSVRDAGSMPPMAEKALAEILQPQQQAAWKSMRSDAAAADPEHAKESGQPKPLDPVATKESAEPKPAEPTAAPPRPLPATAEAKPGPSAEPNSVAKAVDAKPSATAAPNAAALGSKATSNASPSDAKLPDDAVRLRFSFRFQPWKDVLDWFAQQAGLSLVLDAPPPGSFNYTDDRPYSPAEAIDLLNSVLLTKGYALVRRERMLMLVNLQDGIPANLVPIVEAEDLERRGEFEMVSVIFDLERLSPEEAEAEIKKLQGPQGSLVVLGQARQVQVTDTAGRLRNIRKMLRRIEEPDGPLGQVRSYALRQAVPQQVLDVLRQLLDIPPDRTAATDGSVRFAIDTASQRLIVTGKPEKLARVEEILKTLDIPVSGGTSGLSVGAPQLEVYPIAGADPESALKVVQTLLAGQPDVRLSLDPKAGTLVALARPDQQATIRATLDQMQRDGRKVEVIPLGRMDPQLAVVAVNKLFAESGGQAPQVDADPSSRQLLVRGTASQVAQIRVVLEKMGGGPDGKVGQQASTLRLLPLYGRNVRQTLDRVQEIWPTMRENKVRVVSPGTMIHELRPSQDDEDANPTGRPAVADPDLLQRLMEAPPKPLPSAAQPSPAKALPGHGPSGSPAVPGPSAPASPASPPPAARPEGAPQQPAPSGKTALRTRVRAHLVSQAVEKATPSSSDSPQPFEKEKPPQPAPILVAAGPGGVLIACEDTEALDAFEQLLSQLGSGPIAGGSPLTIFYLKHAKAAAVSETLDQVFGGGTSGTSGGGGSLLGDLAGAALGDAGGGMVGTLLGLGGGSITPSGSVRITPDTRLNALVVQANPADLDMIEELLKILDRKGSPEEVVVEPRPRIIPVYHTGAADVAEIIKQVYQDRMTTSAATGGNRSPGPQEFFAMLRGGSRRGGSSSRNAPEEVQKMSVGVDEKTNALVVVAPDPLFQEVKQLIEQLDDAAVDSSQTMRVVTLERASLPAVQRALTAMIGPNIQTTAGARRSATPTASGTPGGESSQGEFRSGFPFPGFPGGFGLPGSSFGFGRFGGPSGPSSGASGPSMGPGSGAPSGGMGPGGMGPSGGGPPSGSGRSYGGRSSRGGEPGR